MPWQEVSVMEQRREFVRLAMQEGINRRELCRRFGISPDVGYKWLRRWVAGDRELADRSRRPLVSPARSEPAIEAAVLAVRIRPGARARSLAVWSGMDLPRLRSRRRMRFYAAMAASNRRPGRPASRIGGSGGRRPTCCGRWTSRAAWLSPAAGPAIR